MVVILKYKFPNSRIIYPNSYNSYDEDNFSNILSIPENNILFSGSGSIDFEWHTQFGENNNLMVTSLDKSENKIEINLSNTHKYIPVEDGFHIFLYDNCTETFVGAARFPIINDYLSDKRYIILSNNPYRIAVCLIQIYTDCLQFTSYFVII